jgi:hypothetical protein
VTPIFAFLSVEVDKKGTDKVEVAARVTYDDVNESLCMAEVVHKVRSAGGPAPHRSSHKMPCRAAVAAAAGWDGYAKLSHLVHACYNPPTPLASAAAAAAFPLQTLGRLGVQWDKKTKAMRVPKDLYANLLSVGSISIDMGGGQQPQQQQQAAAAAANGSTGTVRLGYDAASARDWWKNFVFGKTFVERRSLLTMYRWV